MVTDDQHLLACLVPLRMATFVPCALAFVTALVLAIGMAQPPRMRVLRLNAGQATPKALCDEPFKPG